MTHEQEWIAHIDDKRRYHLREIYDLRYALWTIHFHHQMINTGWARVDPKNG